MSNSLFADDFLVDQSISEWIKAFTAIIIEEIAINENSHRLFMIWKKIGYRISDEEYLSSKQQVRKKNPDDLKLKKIYSIECFVAFIIRIIASNKLNSKFKFNSIKDLIQQFEKMHKGEYSFLFDDDIYNIWPHVIDSPRFRDIESRFLEKIHHLINTTVNLPTEKIFFILHQKILDQESRKLLGEFYTPLELAHIIIQKGILHVVDEPRVLDLSCGSGCLLLTYLNQTMVPQTTSNQNRLSKIVGMDINPLAILMSKCALSFVQMGCKNDVIEPLIFCADSLITYTNIQHNVVPSKSITSKKKRCTNQILSKNSAKSENRTLDHSLKQQNSVKVKIEFLGNLYEITIRNPNLYVNRELHEIRSILSVEIEKSINTQESLIYIPIEIVTEIQNSICKDYLVKLLSDKIIAFYALQQKYDLILGNPPYLRVQSIHPPWKRDALTNSFQSAVGHFDIYYLFIELGITLCSKNGILAYITSNKFITTTSGASIRNIICQNCTITALIDFGDSHVFDALILPIIMVMKRGRTNEKFQMFSLKKSPILAKEQHTLNDLMEFLLNNHDCDEKLWHIESKSSVSITHFNRSQPNDSKNGWNFVNGELTEILDKIKTHSTTTLEQICEKIIVGIKTTANYAFIEDYTYDFINRPDIKEERNRIRTKYGRDLFYPLIQGVDIRNFSVQNSDEKTISYIFFPHYKDSNDNLIAIPEEDLPVMLNYLKMKGYDCSLKKREYIIKAKRKWYEIWNTKDPYLLERDRKIVVPDISPKNNFAIDYHGCYVDGSAYFLVLKEDSDNFYRYILGLLNSYVCEYFHKNNSGNSIYAGRYRYWSTNIKNIPLILPHETKATLVTVLIEKVKALESKYSVQLEDEMNEIIFQIYQIEPELQMNIRDWVLMMRKSLQDHI